MKENVDWWMSTMLTHHMTGPFVVFKIALVTFYLRTSSTLMHSKSVRRSYKDKDKRYCVHPVKNNEPNVWK